MGWNLNEFGLNDSTVNKYRQTYVLFEEIRKTNVEQVNVEQVTPMDRPKPTVLPKSLDEDVIVLTGCIDCG